ncbi:A-kinase anchor protein 14 [Perognathus longimembris pacificus]|uniref:A-kinase anchor protein 14 n=1 Tax=Perognathus longimembris pacificus TaxID=214514 RepID=UPI00201984BD|nr:A-kinase anchor protein 14 [Perognathus longimembris pacificus]
MATKDEGTSKDTVEDVIKLQEQTNVTETALALVEEVIAAAVECVEGSQDPIKNVRWLTHGEFTAERCRRQIHQYVSRQSWESEKRWVCCTTLVRRDDIVHSFRYIYCVRWSVPTALKPMPRVSAAAFFIVKVNKRKPPEMPIDVKYFLEGQALVQRPGTIRFREHWLREVIEAKHLLLESLPI